MYISGGDFVFGSAAQPSPAVRSSSYTSSQGYPAGGGGYSQTDHAGPAVVSTHSYTHAGHGEREGRGGRGGDPVCVFLIRTP